MTKASKLQKKQLRASRPPIQKKSNRPMKASASPAGMESYLRLLRDPCGGDASAAAPYQGSGSGLSVRTVSYVTITAGSTSMDAAVIVRPCKNTVYFGAGNAGAAYTTSSTAVLAPFIQGNASRYRCKAGCAEFIPTGPTSGRAGLIGAYYSPSSVLNCTTNTVNAPRLVVCPIAVSVGSGKHSVKWIPSLADQEWSAENAGTFAGTGGIIVDGAELGFVLQGVDANGTAINGQWKFTFVWDWEPAWNNGLSTQATTPPQFTLNHVLGRLPNVMRFALEAFEASNGAGLIELAGGAMSKYAAKTAYKALSG